MSKPRSRRINENDDAEDHASSDEDELERALAEPRLVPQRRVLSATGRQVQYSRHVLYAGEEADFAADRHELPLNDSRWDSVPASQLGRDLPDPFAEAGYANMDEQADAIAEFRQVVAEDLPRLMQANQRLGTEAALQRQQARQREMQLRRHVGEAMQRAQRTQQGLLHGDWTRAVPASLLPAFLRDARPALAVLLPWLYVHKADMTHQTVRDVTDAMQQAGCLPDGGPRRILLPGRMRDHVPAESRDAYEPGDYDDPSTPVGRHAHWNAAQNVTAMIQCTFKCVFAGDDDDEEGLAEAAAAPDSDDDDGEAQPEDAATARLRAGAEHIRLTEDDPPAAGAADDDDDTPTFRYRVHVLCHDVTWSGAGGEPTLETTVCFRTFYFTR